MSPGVGYLVSEGLRTAFGRRGAFALWALGIALALAAGTALVVLPAEQEERPPHTQPLLLASLSPLLSEADINELSWEVWTWEGTSQVGFRFPGEQDPIPISTRTLLVYVDDAAVPLVQEQLRSLRGVEEVQFLEHTVGSSQGLPPFLRVVALIGLVGALGLELWLGWRAMGLMGADWGQRIALLRDSGVPEGILRAPFLTVGAVFGLLGGLFYLACYWGVWSWAQGEPRVWLTVPSLLTGETLASVLGIVIGILLGVLGGAIWYPPPGHRQGSPGKDTA